MFLYNIFTYTAMFVPAVQPDFLHGNFESSPSGIEKSNYSVVMGEDKGNERDASG